MKRDCIFYRWDERAGIVVDSPIPEEDGVQVVQLIGAESKKHRRQLGKLLVEKWNTMALGNRLAANPPTNGDGI